MASSDLLQNDPVVWIMYVCLLSGVIYLNNPSVTIANYGKLPVFYIVAMGILNIGFLYIKVLTYFIAASQQNNLMSIREYYRAINIIFVFIWIGLQVRIFWKVQEAKRENEHLQCTINRTTYWMIVVVETSIFCLLFILSNAKYCILALMLLPVTKMLLYTHYHVQKGYPNISFINKSLYIFILITVWYTMFLFYTILTNETPILLFINTEFILALFTCTMYHLLSMSFNRIEKTVIHEEDVHILKSLKNPLNQKISKLTEYSINMQKPQGTN